MGTYTDVWVNIKLRDDVTVEEYEKRLIIFKQKQDCYGIQMIEVDNATRYIYGGDNIKSFDEKVLAEFLAPIVQAGTVECNTEGEIWGIIFDGNGGYRTEGATIFYGFDSYNEFMKEHNTDLPPKLKLELEKWHIASKI